MTANDTSAPNLSLGNRVGDVGPGDVVICEGRWAIVQRVMTRPPGHDVPAIRSDMTAVVIETNRGNRVLGADRAWIGPDLRMHWERA